MPKKVKRRVRNAFGEVRACGCGGANLTVGAVTLHLAAEEVVGLRGLLKAAVSMLKAGDEPSSVEQQGRLH